MKTSACALVRVATRTLFLSAVLTAYVGTAEARVAKPAFAESTFLAANQPFEIDLEGEGEAQIAVTLGKLDITSLFERPTPNKLRYHGKGPAFPKGTHTITVYDVAADGAWTSIGQFPIKLLSPLGFVESKFEPTADVTGKGQVGETHTPDDNPPQRPQFQDATTQLGFRTELVRPNFTLRGEGQVAGVTFQQEALRFGSEGERAPRIDLSGYRFDLQRGSTVLSLGHVSTGTSRHLINGFSSRGVALTLGMNRAVSLQLAVMNGTNIVGWSNALGLDNEKHRVYSGTVGIEARPASPGLFRVELGHFVGSSQPESNFNQGSVVTAEESQGNSLRVASALPNGRFRFEGGYTRSRFDDGFDAQVDDGLDVTPIESETKDAYYGELALGLLQNRKIGRTSATVGLTLRHEKIQPQFRSLGASVQGDLRTDAGDLTYSIGSLSGTAAFQQTRDNLASINSILTTRTERSALSLTLPTATMFKRGETESRWAPTISLQLENLHQFADAPPSGDFPLEAIPDEVSWNANAGAEWQIGSWRVGGRFGRTNRDSRQVGTEGSDFVTDTSLLTLGWTSSKPLSLGGEIGFDRNESLEQRKTDNTLRWAANMNWTFYKEMAVAGSISNSRAWDSFDERENDSLESSVELSAGFKLSRGDRRKGRIFVRWIDRHTDAFERQFGLRDVRGNSSIATGLTMSLF